MNISDEFPESVCNMSTICRLCLTVNEKLFQLFRTDELDASAIPLSVKVTLCTAIKMSKQDILPKKICQDCLNYVNEWYKFRKKCMKNDVYLKNCLSSTSKKELEQMGNNKSVKDSLNAEENGQSVDKQIEASYIQGNDIADEPSKMENKLILANLDACMHKPDDYEQTNIMDIVKQPLLKAPTKKFKCPSCPDSFYYVKDLKIHKSVVHRCMRSEKPSVKETVTVKDEDIKLDEIKVKTRYEMKCCEKVFFSKARFRRHYNKKHPGEKPYMCETCGKKDFISEETLKRHKILHTGKYRCEICSKTFTCNAILIIHKRDKHENDKPFICDVCGKRFVTELLMNYHKRFHTGEKKYVCEECGLAVVTSSSLAKHKRIHSNVKPHVCQVCGKGFIIKGRLVEHLRIHTGERPYSCHICHKGFTMRDKLKRHLRIHSGEKLFSCEYCGNNYSTSYGLTVHLRSHIIRNY